MDGNFLLPTLVYGCEKPEIRFRMHEGRQLVFCLHNGNLHLTGADLDEGTYETGTFLGSLCKEHCLPKRTGYEPCPAFARSHKVGTDNKGLATVEMYPVPKWDLCLGVQKVLHIEMTPEERFFLLAYLEAHWTDEFTWRDSLVDQWNAHWYRVENGWGARSRSAMFDQMIWWTLRYPALIPQVWLNWLHAAPEDLVRTS